MSWIFVIVFVSSEYLYSPWKQGQLQGLVEENMTTKTKFFFTIVVIVLVYDNLTYGGP